MSTEHRCATRRLIRTCEKLTARFVRALRANDPDRVLDALLALRAFVDEGIAGYGLDPDTLQILQVSFPNEGGSRVPVFTAETIAAHATEANP